VTRDGQWISVMAEMNWSRRFEDPILTPIRTIGEAAEYGNVPAS
jgi:hypothetical protein